MAPVAEKSKIGRREVMAMGTASVSHQRAIQTVQATTVQAFGSMSGGPPISNKITKRHGPRIINGRLEASKPFRSMFMAEKIGTAGEKGKRIWEDEGGRP